MKDNKQTNKFIKATLSKNGEKIADLYQCSHKEKCNCITMEFTKNGEVKLS